MNWLACIPAVSKYHADFEISDIYEPLQFNLFSKSRRVNFVKIEKVLAECPSFAVVGGAGSGKSTLLHVLAIAYAEDRVESLYGLKESRLPLFFNLKDFSEPKPLPSILADSLNSSGCKYCKTEFIETQLKSGRCIVLLDGLDETADDLRKKEIIPWIDKSMAAYPHNRYIISSREPEWGEREIPGLPKISIRELSWPQIQSIISKWEAKIHGDSYYNDSAYSHRSYSQQPSLSHLLDEKENSEARKLAESPLFLTLMIILNDNGISIPIRKHELYTTFINVLLNEWEDSKNITLIQMSELAREIEYLMNFFSKLSLFLLENSHESIDLKNTSIRNKCEELLIEITGRDQGNPKLFLDNIYKRTGLINKISDSKYLFIVRGFHEFLTAYAIANYSSKYTILKYFNDESWFETILNFSALAHDPESFFNDLTTLPTSSNTRQLENSFNWGIRK